MIDFKREQLLKIDDVTHMMRVHRRTVEGWFKRGLERVRVGGLVYTSQEALQRFARDDSQYAPAEFSGSTKESIDAGRQLEAQFGV